MKRLTFQGIPASPGITIGKAFLLDVAELTVPAQSISEAEVEINIKQFRRALQSSSEELKRFRDQVHSGLGQDHASIFDAHLQFLKDPMLVDEVIEIVREEKLNIRHVFGKRVKEMLLQFEQMDNAFFRERKSDLYDVARRVITHLQGQRYSSALDQMEEEMILVAHDISPSDAAYSQQRHVTGFITEIGSQTSHTAILARALAIPAVVGVPNVTHQMQTGNVLILDGTTGTVIVNPNEEEIEMYRKKQNEYKIFEEGLAALRTYPAETTDGYRIELAANIELHEEVNAARQYGANGVGLYRTEFLFMNRSDLPSEAEQVEAYSTVLREISPYPATIRTIDLGGDKFISPLEFPRELNPDLGCRGIRLCLQRQDIFRTQLRALLRASTCGTLRIMFPMVSNIEEVQQAKALIQEIREELQQEGIPVNDSIEIGVMIEVPSAALISDQLATEVDFFSIGTNDLIQYTLSVDRRNERIAYMYAPLHPAVLRLIRRVVHNAHKHGIWVGVCGEMASDPLAAIALRGLDVDELSVSPFTIPLIKRTIRLISFIDAWRLMEDILELPTASAIREKLNETFGKKVLLPFK